MSQQKSLRRLQRGANAKHLLSHHSFPTLTPSTPTEAIISMLNLNNRTAEDTPSAASSTLAVTDPVWKVLIYDQLGQDIISPLLKVNDLRENGVTVHMNINSERQPIPDVPAIYFLQPTAENIKKITEDFTKQLYESYYINFSSTIPRPLLEDLATSTLQTGAATQIAQVYDQYLNFVCLEPNLFSLQLADSYRTLNDPSASDSSIEALTDRIVSSLFSTLITMGVVPVIRAPRGNAAAQVATKLNSRLRDHVINSKADFYNEGVGGLSLSRPVLVLLDRNMDLTTMLNHTWTYSTLVHDLLDMNLNRVVIFEEEGGNKKRKVFDIDVNDFFWTKNAGNPFPQVAEDVDMEINKYKADSEELSKSMGVGSLEEIDASNDFSANARGLSSVIQRLPELTERKRILDMHMNIATNLFKQIQERQLDQFFSAEENILKQNKTTLLEAIRDPKKSSEDKLRLFIIYYLSVEDVSKDDFAEFEKALGEAGCEVAALRYVKQIRAFFKMTAMSNAAPVPSGGASDFFGKIGSKFTDHLKDAGVAGHFDNLISGVKNLLPLRKDLPATRVVDAIMEGTTGGETDDYLYLDPKAARDTGGGKQGKNGRGGVQGYQDAIVFVVGGGNYLEYQNLQEYALRVPGQRKRIVYGSTEISAAKVFLGQLEQLGASSQ
ncbi:Vesicle trafficking between the ER and Golgi [Rhizophlyctis rosea]|nr:Vesicle trafficking between the ER and Golgi [Rhizophlyctis rosea]